MQKPGFLIPEAKVVKITEYDKLYPIIPFQLKAITIMGQTNVVNNSGESVSIEGAALTLHVKQADKEGVPTRGIPYEETLPADGRFQFEPAVHSWLKVGKEYELQVTGGAVLNVKPVRFTYDGYTDINTDMTVTLDDIPCWCCLRTELHFRPHG